MYHILESPTDQFELFVTPLIFIYYRQEPFAKWVWNLDGLAHSFQSAGDSIDTEHHGVITAVIGADNPFSGRIKLKVSR